MATKKLNTMTPSYWHWKRTDTDQLNHHKSMPQLKWLGSGTSGNALVKLTEGTLTPTHGNLSSDRPFEEKNANLWSNYTTNKDIYNPAANQGGEFKKNNSTSECAVNMAFTHYGDNGLSIPAGLIRSVGFESQRMTAANSNWRVWNMGLEFVNLMNDQVRLYTPGWTKSYNAATGYDFSCFNGESHFNTIRSWGPDWVLKRVIVNCRSNSTSGNQTPRMRLYHLKIGWEGGVTTPMGGPAPSTDFEIVVPSHKTFNDYKTDYKNGKVEYGV